MLICAGNPAIDIMSTVMDELPQTRVKRLQIIFSLHDDVNGYQQCLPERLETHKDVCNQTAAMRYVS